MSGDDAEVSGAADAVPGIPEFRGVLTEDAVTALRIRFEDELARGRVRLPLNRRTRLRLALMRGIDEAAIRLVNRGRYDAARRLWRATRLVR